MSTANERDRTDANCKKAMELQDLNKALQMSTGSGVQAKSGTLGINLDNMKRDKLDPDKFYRRLEKISDIPLNGPSRLVQGLGEDGTADLMSTVNQMRTQKALMESMSSTCRIAVKELLREHLHTNSGISAILPGSRYGVDFSRALKDFDGMDSVENQFPKACIPVGIAGSIVVIATS